MKVVKWILLGISIIFITILITIYFKGYYKNDNDYNNAELSSIFSKSWYGAGYSMYDLNDNLTGENNSYEKNYMVFSLYNIQYCSYNLNKCESYEYKYANGKIYMPADYFVVAGEYEIVFNENKLDLIEYSDRGKMVHHFVSADG